MPPSYFPLRWESTGDQWWYASPIDWAAANGHFDLVRELLHIDPNLLIKLTSLRRIRRLEIVWDDDSRFADVARCRSSVARSLLLLCEVGNGHNTLIRAGYGGWLLYTAASAGDMGFVLELLQKDPLLVFGEGEFGVTDILYAAARSKNSEVFRVLLDFSMSPRCLINHLREGKVAESSGYGSVFRWEMMTRAVHAAARGGNWEILRELLSDCGDVLAYRDVQGSTVLHTASGRGQVEVVKNLVASFNIIDSKDNEGNTSLHVAAFRGHLAVLEALVVASPSSISLTNNMGDTFLHIAVSGFRNPSFRRLDRQMELMKQLVLGTVINIEEIINFRNNDGRTLLHMAVGYVQGDLVSLLMTVRSINLNVRDINGMTPLDLLNQHPRSASSEMMIRQLISAGGMSNSRDRLRRSVISPRLRMKGIRCSPGTSFKISDSEIFLYTGIEASDGCEDRGTGRPSSSSSISQTDLIPVEPTEGNHTPEEKKRHSSVSNAASRIKTLLRWPRKKDKKTNSPLKTSGDEASVGSFKKSSEREDTYTPTPLRQRFSKTTSLQNNKRTLAVRTSTPSPSTKKKLSAGLMHGVIEAMPHLAPPRKSPSSPSRPSTPSPLQNIISSEIETVDPSLMNTPSNNVSTGGVAQQKSGSFHAKLRRHYFCFGAQGLALEDSANGKQQSKRFFKRGMLSVS